MTEKELKAKERELKKELEKEKSKKKKAEQKLSLYEYKEKQKANKSKPKIDDTQKHTIVDHNYFENDYNYDRRRKEWHQKAGHNETQLVCDYCKDDDNWETILLDNNKHVCYYCWIKKPSSLGIKSTTKKTTTNKKQTTKTTTKTTKVNTAKAANTTNTKTTKVDNTKKDNSSKKTQSFKVVPIEIYEEYDSKKRFDQWDKYVNENNDGVKCDFCNSKDNVETILLENGKNICYYCWIDEPSTASNTKNNQTKAKTNAPVDVEHENVDTPEAKGPGKLFWIISITLGILLIGLIVILSLGIISGNFDFNFNN